MFTIEVSDERIYKRLLEAVQKRGVSFDEVLRELLHMDELDDSILVADEPTPAQILLHLIDTTDMPFENSFNARDAKALLDEEAGGITWRMAKDDDGSI